MSENFQRIDLRDLAELEGPPRSFLSFYWAGEGAKGTLDRRVDAARKLLADDAEGRERFDAGLARLEHLMTEHDLDSAAGYALFACDALDVERAYPLSVAPMLEGVPAKFHVGRSPYLRPLAELQDEYEAFLLVAVDNDGARIFEVEGHSQHEGERVKGGVKNRVKKGGWSQQRYARRRRNQLHRYAEEVAEQLTEMTEGAATPRIVLLGSEETMRAVDECLPDRVRKLVIAEEPFDLHRSDDDLVDAGFEQFVAEERREEKTLWERIRDEYFADGRGAVGPKETLEAVQSGRADNLAVHHDADLTGSRCGSCTNVFHEEHDRCPYCDSDEMRTVALVDEMVRLAEQTDAHVEFVKDVPSLAESGGVAALLRW